MLIMLILKDLILLWCKYCVTWNRVELLSWFCLDADQCLAVDSAWSQNSDMGVNSQSGQVFWPLFPTVNYSAASQEQALFLQVLPFGETWRGKAKAAALQKEIHTLNINFFPVWSLHT